MNDYEELLQRRTRRAKWYWIPSLIWAVLVLVVAGYFVKTAFDFQRTEADLSHLQAKLADQEQRANQLILDLQTLQTGLASLEKTTLQRMDDYDRQLHILSLQRRSTDELSEAQKDLVKEQAEKTGNDPTPMQLVVQGYAKYLEGQYSQAIGLYNAALR